MILKEKFEKTEISWAQKTCKRSLDKENHDLSTLYISSLPSHITKVIFSNFDL